jgi:hypothetical protein
MTRVLSLLLYLIAASAHGDEAAILDKDFRIMMEWFPGVYDNQEQVYFEEQQGIDEVLRHERIHHVFEPVELPAFGDHVFYVQQHLNDDPAQIYRQRIYSFRPDYEEGAVRLTIHIPNDAASLVDAHLDATKLSGLLPEQTRVLPGCDVYWQRQANHFVGYMEPDACSYVSTESGQRILFNDDLLLTEDELWISDRAEDEAGNKVFGHPAGVPHKNVKARRFECWMTGMQRDGEWTFRRGLEIYDQGGRVWLSTDEEDPQQVGIKMRNVRWPSDPNRPSLVLYAYRPGEDRAVSYAWADPTAERIGINLRWMQASCTYSPR